MTTSVIGNVTPPAAVRRHPATVAAMKTAARRTREPASAALLLAGIRGGGDRTLEDLGLAVLGALVQDRPDGFDDFFHRLMELHFRGVLGDHVFHEGSNALSHVRSP